MKPEFRVPESDPPLWAPSTQKRHGIPKYSRSHMPMQQGNSTGCDQSQVNGGREGGRHWDLKSQCLLLNFKRFSPVAILRLKNCIFYIFDLVLIILFFFGQSFLFIYAVCERRFQIIFIIWIYRITDNYLILLVLSGQFKMIILLYIHRY